MHDKSILAYIPFHSTQGFRGGIETMNGAAGFLDQFQIERGIFADPEGIYDRIGLDRFSAQGSAAVTAAEKSSRYGDVDPDPEIPTKQMFGCFFER
jgi:hypothetical protein